MTLLIVRGLGRAELTLGDLVLAPGQGMLFPLALVLAQRSGERIPRRDLIELIWPEADERAGRHSLRQALYRLRKAGLSLDDSTDDVRVDPARVDSDLTAVLRHDWPYRAAPEAIDAAASVLPGFVVSEGGSLAEWLDALRARIAAQHRQATLHRIAMARREGRWREADEWAQACLRADPLNEEATCARAEALAMVGAKNAALEVLDTYLRELGDRAKVIGLPARLLRRRISELTDTTGRRVTATSVPFIGRHDLLALAQDTLARARRGEPTVQWFTGPPGIGKSRLMGEVTRAARMAGWCAVAGGACPSYEERPFATLTELLPQLLEAPGALGADPGALHLMRQMGRADTGEEPLPPEEARVRQHAVYLAWVELMDAVLAEAPLAILVDDAHWSDPLTLLMFARFIESRPTAKLAVILLARRVPVRDDGGAKRVLGASQARIAPMTDAEMLALTRAAGVGGDVAAEEVATRLGAVSGGNPLFLGHLLHQHQTHREPQTMPVDLATLIDDQIRTLSREALRLLQVCALLGRHASLPRVERVLGLTAAQLVLPFGELDDLLALPSDLGQALAPHDLWTERVRRGMTAGVFRTMAVSVARVLEADAQDDGGIEIYWDAARLYQDSGEKQLAFATMMRCAEYLMRAGAASDAARSYEAALEYASTPKMEDTALRGRTRALQTEEAWSDVLATTARIESLDLRRSADQAASDLLSRLFAQWWLGSGDSALLTQLRRVTADHQVSSATRLNAAMLGMAVCDNCLEAEELRLFFEQSAGIDRDSLQAQLAGLKCEVIYETSLGSFERAETSAGKLLAVARDSGDEVELFSALKFAHYPPRRTGDFTLGHRRLEQALAISVRRKREHAKATVVDLFAGLHFDYGFYEQAETIAHDVTEHPDLIGGVFRQQSARETRAQALLFLGREEEARPLVSPPAMAMAGGRRRPQYMSLASTTLLATFDRDKGVVLECVAAFDEVRDRLFRNAGGDSLAIAFARGLAYTRGHAASAEFVHWYLTVARRGTLPVPSLLPAATER
ncbi:MAG: AAA family ATPase [Gemmatimonadetes bacterium]|nr:AAA family ATPase [Gemmatimonadota bacterium]